MHDEYLAFLPPALRPDPLPPRVAEVWRWRGHDVHIERTGDEHAPVRLLMLHGAGGNSGLLWPVAAAAAARGCHVVVPDLPGYGRTRVRRPGAVRYPDWVGLACDLVRAEKSDRPLWILGASMGGLLAYEAATRTGLVDRVIATCLFDPREPLVRRHIGRLGPLGAHALRLARGPLGNVRVPIRWVANMRAISNDPAVTALVLADRRGGGNRVPLGFLRTFLWSAPAVEPEDATAPEIVLAHPAEDRWTPVAASLPFYERLATPKKLVLLPDGGHLPVEPRAVAALLDVLTP